MKSKKRILYAFFMLAICFLSDAQTGLGTVKPNNSAKLDINADDRGLLIPRIALVLTTNQSPIKGSIANSLMVYNTAISNDVTPGYYYWEQNKWVRLLSNFDAVVNNNWSLKGNTGTSATVAGTTSNYIGTNDNKALNFRVNGTHAGWIDADAAKLNVALGLAALGKADVAAVSRNVAVGYQALAVNESNSNTAVGYRALVTNTKGYGNVAVGYQALAKNLESNNNVTVGGFAGYSLLTGDFNTMMGDSAGRGIGSGSNNSFFGNWADADTPVYNSNLSYATAIGAGAKVGASNSMVLGGTKALNYVKVGIGNTTPTTTLHITPQSGTNPLRLEGLQGGTTTDDMVTVDATGVFKKIPALKTGTMKIKKTIANITINDATDDVLLVDASAGNVNVTVPAGINAGRVFIVKRVDNSNNSVTIQIASAGTIDQMSTPVSVSSMVSYQLITEGSNKWYVINKL